MTKRELGTMCCKLIAIFVMLLGVTRLVYSAGELVGYFAGARSHGNAAALLGSRTDGSAIAMTNTQFHGQYARDALLIGVATAATAIGGIVVALILWFAAKRLSRAIPGEESGKSTETAASLLFLLTGAWLLATYAPALAAGLGTRTFFASTTLPAPRFNYSYIAADAVAVVASIWLMLAAGWLARIIARPSTKEIEHEET